MERSKAETFERRRLAELKNRLFAYEQVIKDERRKLWEFEQESEVEDTIWGELELLSTYIFGYVSQIVSQGNTRQQPSEVISHLHELSIFNTDCIVNWYTASAVEYPNIKQHFELLDYLRLLTLDYVKQHLLQKPTANAQVGATNAGVGGTVVG